MKTTVTLLDIAAVLFALSALFGFFNHKLLRLPHTVGLVLMALLASGAIVAFDAFAPWLGIGKGMRDVLQAINFKDVLLEGFLCALLFAGAVHVDLTELAERKWAIGLMATIGVLFSTLIVGVLIWLVAGQLGIALPFMWALVFGALISPTDPVAVLGILKVVRVPRLLQAKIAGESLLNDGVGVVVFTVLLAIATGSTMHGGGQIDTIDAVRLFAVEALGGAMLGLMLGLLAFGMMRAIEQHVIEVLITLALVTGAYALALRLHLSGPIAVVVCGLLIGNQGARFAMTASTRQHVFQFWELVDEILNSVLFLLIGLEVLVIGISHQYLWLTLAAIPIVLFARLVGVAIPISLLRLRETFADGAIRILTWAGLRGGISVALALSLPESPYKAAILTATYGVVIFSILIQGLTVEPLVRRIVKEAEADPSRPMAATTEEIRSASAAVAESGKSGRVKGRPSRGRRARRRGHDNR